METESTFKNLGCLNGYSETPDEVKRCWEKAHLLEGRKLGNCYYEYFCDECRIRYSIDSSG